MQNANVNISDAIVEEHLLEGLFVIKGSKDYPSGQSISEPYGYDKDIETPIFKSSLRDVYISVPDIIEVNNGYSGYEDSDNYIGINPNVTLDHPSPRMDRTDDFVSTILIKNGSKDEAYKFINPNFEFEPDATGNKYGDFLINSTTNPGTVLGTEGAPYNVRTCVFWQKMFSMIEYIKKNEKIICQLHLEGLEYSDDWNTRYVNTGYYSNGELTKNYVKTLNPLAQMLAIYHPYSTLTTDNVSVLAGEDKINGGLLKYNLPRMEFIDGTVNESYTTHPETFKDVCKNNIILDQLANFYTTDTGAGDDVYVFNGIDLKFEGFSSIVCTFSSNKERITKVAFDVSFRDIVIGDAVAAHRQKWSFVIYFDPDAFVNSVSANSSEKFPVWTYNDEDIDNTLRGVDHQYDTANPKFNKYDNDYCNMLIPATDEDGNPTVHGKFVASQSEITTQMVSAVADKIKNGGFANFVELPVRRISPYIDVSGPVPTVAWATDKPATQIFYIFYKNVPPTEAEQLEAVRNYLDQLHSDSTHCTGMHYINDDEAQGVEFIGHDADSEEDRAQFLSKMYPDIFSLTTVHIIPAKYDHCRGDISGSDIYADPSNYYSTVTPERMVESITNGSSNTTNFTLSPNGYVSAATGLNTAYPVEVFKIGAINSDTNQETSYKYDFPWYAINKSTNTPNCLTSITGMNEYKQKNFQNHEPSSNADRFQFILLVLTGLMFEESTGTFVNHSKTKRAYNSILGVSIAYDFDTKIDPNLLDSGDVGGHHFNVASFTINAVNYIVYAQRGKTFGYSGAGFRTYQMIGG